MSLMTYSMTDYKDSKWTWTLTHCILLPSADNLCQLIRPKSGLAKPCVWSESKTVWLSNGIIKELFESRIVRGKKQSWKVTQLAMSKTSWNVTQLAMKMKSWKVAQLVMSKKSWKVTQLVISKKSWKVTQLAMSKKSWKVTQLATS